MSERPPVISIVICSRNEDISPELRRNIEDTVGWPHELIVIDNSRRTYSICEAYNAGIAQAHGEVVCFMHDDVWYRCQGWGKSVSAHFDNASVGMIGLGGTRYLSRVPGVWWGGGLRLIGRPDGTICHNSIDSSPQALGHSVHRVINPTGEKAVRVVALDGLWFCIRKSLFDEVSFDATTFRGFHMYDLDMSLQMEARGKGLLVVYDVVVEHTSVSALDRSWISDCLKLFRKWRLLLPVSCVDLAPDSRKVFETDNLRTTLRILKTNGWLARGLMMLTCWHPVRVAYLAVDRVWPLVGRSAPPLE